MAGALNILLIICLLHGVLSADFGITLPKTIEAVAGYCVTIQCSFTIKDTFETQLDNTCKAMWKKGNYYRTSSFTTERFITTATAIDLKKKTCTSSINNIQTTDDDTYFFRLECNKKLQYTFKSGVKINVKADSPKPTVTPSELKVEEGAPVSLQCSVPAPCQTLTVTVTWTPRLGTSVMEEHNKDMISVLKFTASNVHHRQTFTCTAVYKRQDNSIISSISKHLTADVKYQPRDIKVSVRPSGPVRETTNVVLTCSSDANPAVKTYTWYRAGHEAVIHTGHDLNFTAARNSGDFLCQAQNDLGTKRSDKTNIDVQYAPQNTKVSVHPSGPVREGTNVVLTCSSDANPAVKTYTWYRAGHEAVIHTGHDLNFTASRNSGDFLCQAQNHLETERSDKTNIDVQFSPQILSSSNCTKAVATVSCSCSTVGNPSPRLHWYLGGVSVNNSDKVNISSESVSSTGVRSTITVTFPQDLDLLCHSSNSVGATVHQFYIYTFQHQTTAFGQGQEMILAFITTVAILLILVCVLLFVIRTLKTHPTHPSTATMNQLLDENVEVPSATEKDIYANTNRLSQGHKSRPGETNGISLLDDGQGDGKSSQDKQEDEVIYSSVIWVSKKKKKKDEDRGDAQPSCSYLEEEKYMMGEVCKDFISNAVHIGNHCDDRKPRNVRKEEECEYAQVKYKVKSVDNQ